VGVEESVEERGARASESELDVPEHSTPTTAGNAPRHAAPGSRHDASDLLRLAEIGVAQLMVVLDLSVMNIALPSPSSPGQQTTAEGQVLMPGNRATTDRWLLVAAGAMAWLAQLGSHSGYTDAEGAGIDRRGNHRTETEAAEDDRPCPRPSLRAGSWEPRSARRC
jgi:hypothetical protein